MMILEFVNLFCAGILAGIEIVVHYGLHKPTLALEEKPQIILRQRLIYTLRWLVPCFFVPMAVSGITLAIIGWLTPGNYFRVAALITIAAWILVRVVGTVPVNSATIEWNPDAPPKDWKLQISKVERFHIIGTWAAILGFAFFIIAFAQTSI